MDNTVDVFALVGDTRGGILVLLRRDFQACSLQDRLNLVVGPSSASVYRSA